MQSALQDFNIEIVTIKAFQLEPMREAKLWSLIDPNKSRSATSELLLLDPDIVMVYLPFEVRYQLEVCISREIINEYNIDEKFINSLAKIAAQDPAKARNLLEYVAENYSSKRLYNPSSIFSNDEALEFSSASDIPHYCALSRKATVTPTSIYFSSPTVETTNRVLRYYSKENKEGRFLRVQFTDEKSEVCSTISTNALHTNHDRVASMPALIRFVMMEYSHECFEHLKMGFELVIGTMNF